jgi:hypothetical protein
MAATPHSWWSSDMLGGARVEGRGASRPELRVGASSARRFYADACQASTVRRWRDSRWAFQRGDFSAAELTTLDIFAGAVG